MEDPAELLDSKAELDQEEIERLLRENRGLKGRLDELERENRLLKQRNFDLSMRYGRSAENRRQPFEIVFSDSDLDDDEDDDNNIGELNSGTDDHVHSRNSVSEDIISATTPNKRNSFDLGLATTGNSSISSVTFSEECTEGSTRSTRNNGKNKRVSASYSSVGESATDSDVNNVGPRAPPPDYTVHSNSSHQEDTTGVKATSKPSSHDVYGSSQSLTTDKPEYLDETSRHMDTEAAVPKEKRGQRDNEEQRHGAAANNSGSASRRKEAKQLKCYAELDNHEGAIYSVQYSPPGSFVASASFDKTVRVWDISEQKQTAVLNGHQQTAFDVAWRYDSTALVSAGFDRTCIEWDLEAKQPVTHLSCDGLVQCVRYSTHNPRIVYSGDSSGFISIHDLRQPQGATKLSNDGSMVNTIYCFNDETRLVSGDRNGEIKMWDVRIGRFMRLVNSSSQSHAISHISVVKNEKSGTEYMAANSYDNVLRVYDRVDDPSVPTPRAIHELRGIRSRNWPIKNAFFDPLVAQEQLLGLYNDDYFELDTRLQNEARGLQSMLFLVT
ncbi:hypothetical protein EV175_004437, partial [Coemansia sp. RSA 1933]